MSMGSVSSILLHFCANFLYHVSSQIYILFYILYPCLAQYISFLTGSLRSVDISALPDIRHVLLSENVDHMAMHMNLRVFAPLVERLSVFTLKSRVMAICRHSGSTCPHHWCHRRSEIGCLCCHLPSPAYIHVQN